MSQPAKLVSKLEEGDYRITSVTLPISQPIGVVDNKPETEFLRENAPVWVWHIKPVDGFDAHRLSLVNAYPYTGVEHSRVIATKDKGEDRVWYIYEHNGHHIISAAPIWPTPAWTLIKGQIVIRAYELQPEENQLFDIVKTSA